LMRSQWGGRGRRGEKEGRREVPLLSFLYRPPVAPGWLWWALTPRLSHVRLPAARRTNVTPRVLRFLINLPCHHNASQSIHD
jgi:hypothetical protein